MMAELEEKAKMLIELQKRITINESKIKAEMAAEDQRIRLLEQEANEPAILREEPDPDSEDYD